jgi:hypothetical protein
MHGYLTFGGVEITNEARLETYLQTVGSPLTDAGSCGCPTFTAATVGDAPYSTPEEDQAPWYDPDVPESADFAGFRVLSIEGLDDYPVRRTVTGAVTGGGALGPARVLPRTITVTGILLGATCCAVEYGLHWLAEAMTGCAGAGCDGDCLTLFNCCPSEEETPEEFRARHLRTLRRVALTQGPTVTARAGDGCASGTCATGADILTVELVLVAGSPWLWTEPTPILDVDLPADDSEECVTWCVHGQPPATQCVEVTDSCPPASLSVPVVEDGAVCALAWPVSEEERETCEGTCRFAPCTDPMSRCADPLCAPPSPPMPAVLDTCYCLPLAVEADYYDLDLTDRPGWSVDVPVITLHAGGGDLRNVTITFYERPVGGESLTCEEVAQYQRCHPHSQYHVAYVPANGAVRLDGQTGRAVVECGATCETSRDVYGLDGAPPTFEPFACGTLCVKVETDLMNPPPLDARLMLAVSGRGY